MSSSFKFWKIDTRSFIQSISSFPTMHKFLDWILVDIADANIKDQNIAIWNTGSKAKFRHRTSRAESSANEKNPLFSLIRLTWSMASEPGTSQLGSDLW